MGNGIENRQLFQAIFDSSVEGILVMDDEGNLIKVNPALEKIFGYDTDELLNLKVEALIPVKFREAHGRLREKYVKRPEARSMGKGMHILGLRKDGSQIPVEVSLSPTAIDGRQLVIAFVVDITERSNVMHALVSSERRMAEVQRIAHVGRGSFQMNSTEYAVWTLAISDSMQRLLCSLSIPMTGIKH